MIRIDNNEETSISLGPDLTPLLDVVFIVMVFLLFTANAQTLSLPVDLPGASHQEATLSEKQNTITVSILSEGQPWALGEKRFENWDLLTIELLARIDKQPETTVLIAGDESAPLGQLVKLMMFLSKHKIEAAQILMEETSL